MENSGLHQDLLFQILTRLPVKSFLRFRCVSKSWRSLISSQYFSKMHLEQSFIDPKPLGLIWKDDELDKNNHRIGIFAADFSNFENPADRIHQIHHPFEDYSWHDSTLIGSCNRLLCLVCPCYKGFCNTSGYFERYVVFNPLTRRCTSFPGPIGMYPCGRSCFYGFGYDDAHDDYKVVTWGVRPQHFGAMADRSKFDVYSVRDNSWSTRTSGLTKHYIFGISCGILVNCRLHWIWRNNEDTYCIVAFDLRNEEHTLIETTENNLVIPEFYVLEIENLFY